MADGSLIATIARQGAATEQAIQAVRSALFIKERYPDSLVALATGRAVLEGGSMFGEALGRVGMLVETARKLARLPAGAVLIDETSSRLVENHFTIRRDGSGLLLLSGASETADETRPLLGMPTQCVGRERELNLLEATFASCYDNSAATAVLVSAAPGVGKSRLRHEFLRRIQTKYPDVILLTGRGDPMSAGASYGLLAQALRRWFEIVESEEIGVRREKIRKSTGERMPADDAQRVAEFLGEICGTPFLDSVLLRAARQDPRVMGDQVSQGFVDFLSALCMRNPVLLVLEDLHWGDALTVKLVGSALRDLTDRPLMVLSLARPEVEDLFPKLWADRGRQDIRLAGLPKRACERLIHQVLGNKISPQIQARIIEQSAGNALFLEELIRAVSEGKGDELPETVLAILHARLMRMAPEARRVLRIASIFGETFWDGGVRKLLGRERGGEQCASWLQILVEAEIIERRRESRFPGEVEYAFRHGLVRDAAYGMLPDEDRLIGHYMAGCFLETVGETDPMVLAEHFQRSGDLARAIVLYTRAAEKAYEGNDLEGVFRCAKRGLECGAEGETRGALYSLQTAAWFWRNDLEHAVRIGLEALSLLALGNPHWLRAITWTTVSAAALGKRAQVAELSLHFGTVTPKAESLGMYVEAASLVATMLGLIGDREMAELFLSHAVQIGETLAHSDPYIRGWMHYALGRHANSLQPRPWYAIQNFQIACDAFRAMGDRRMTAVSMGDLGFTLARLGATKEAEDCLREGQRLALRLSEPITLTWVQMPLALLLVENPEPASQAEAKRLVDDMLSVTGDKSYYSGTAYCVLAAVYGTTGDFTQAEHFARRALEVLRPTQSSTPLGFIALANTLLLAGRADEAVQVATEGLELVKALGGSGGSEVPLRIIQLKALQMQRAEEKATQAQAALDHQIELRIQDILDPVYQESYLARIHARNGRSLLF